MKKIISFILCICLIGLSFCGCSKQDTASSSFSEDVIVEEIIIDNTSGNSEISSNGSVTAGSSSTTNSSDVTSGVCSHSYNETVQQTAVLFKAGVKKYTCTKCEDSYTKTYPVEKLKILVIGHSYSKNAVWQLYDICHQAGVKEIDIATMYIAGCSLDAHWENIQKNAGAYEVFRNNSGKWNSTLNRSIDSLLNEGDWDIIVLQNSPGGAARENAFNNFDNVVNYVSGKCPSAKLLWHMTWGFTQSSEWMDTSVFPGGEKQMYDYIINNVKNIVVPNNKIHAIIPAGTAVMNARTSRLKNQVHLSDGSHLSENAGYYVAAFTWFGTITGMPLYDVNYIALNPTISANMNVFIESAENALKNPYSITPSRY